MFVMCEADFDLAQKHQLDEHLMREQQRKATLKY